MSISKAARGCVAALAGTLIIASTAPVVRAQPVGAQTPGVAAAIVMTDQYTVPRIAGATANPIPGAMINHGGPVQNAPTVYVVFWGWTSDPSGEATYLKNFLSSLGGNSWLNTVIQYGGGNPTNLYGGAWSDPTPIPTQPSDAQIQTEAVAAINHFGLGTSVNIQIVVATPTGHSAAGFISSYCAYHGAIAAHPSATYTNLPYLTDAGAGCGANSVNGSNGNLDGVSIVEGHELAEAVTDPLVNVNSAWYDANGNEIGDKCAWTSLGNITTSAGTFAMQPLWSNALNNCTMSASQPPPTSPPPPTQCSVIKSNQGLVPGLTQPSCDGRFTLSMQFDGNLVLYQGGTPLWATNTVGKNTAFAVMQGDGNFILYNTSGQSVWSSNTAGHPGASINAQNDGNLVIYDASNNPIWASNTCCHPLQAAPPTYTISTQTGPITCANNSAPCWLRYTATVTVQAGETLFINGSAVALTNGTTYTNTVQENWGAFCQNPPNGPPQCQGFATPSSLSAFATAPGVANSNIVTVVF